MLTLKINPHTKVDTSKKGTLSLSSTIRHGGRELVLKDPSRMILTCLKKLQQEGSEEQALSDLALKQGDLTSFYYFLNLLKRNNLLSYALLHKNKPLLTLHPLSSRLQIEERSLAPTQKIQLSKFAFLRPSAKNLILETPLAPVECEIHSQEILAVLHQLTNPKSLKEIRSPIPRSLVEKLCTLLLEAKILVPAKSEEKDPLALQWEFHDLLFHTRTRLGRHNNPYGGLFPFTKEISPLPACKPPMSKRRTPLFKPDIEKLKREDRSFTHVIEERRSKREHGNNPLTLKQLGEFLFRTARMKEHLIYPKGETHGAELSRRPYPGGGAVYELELYLVIYKCQGLEKGIYHYHPREHTLYQLEAEQKNIDALLRDSMHSSGKKDFPQVFFIITSRFQRMSWKYRSMAYAATLKTTGVLLQTMYLVATAMDLAPCAIGGGDSDLFSEAIGTSYLEETSVGEFMLGSREQ